MEIGQRILGKHIGKVPGSTYIWLACLGCGKQRWVLKEKKQAEYCRNCSSHMIGNKARGWRGGERTLTKRGYIRVYISPDDFFYPMAGEDGRVMEHRLVMAKYLGRCLHSWEIVHHKNNVRTDNRLENLQLVTDDRHTQITILENQVTRLKKQNNNLKEVIKCLMKELAGCSVN